MQLIIGGTLKEEISFRNAEEILREKGLLIECRKIASSDWGKVARDLNWGPEKIIEIKAPENNLKPRFDFFKNRVAISHEKIEQMRARWHLMKMEIGFRKDKVDVGVMSFPKDKDCSLRRTENE